MKTKKIVALLLLCAANLNAATWMQRAEKTWMAIDKAYSMPGTPLFCENFPQKQGNYTPTYLANGQQAMQQVEAAYLWPFSGTISAIRILVAQHHQQQNIYADILKSRLMPALKLYLDTTRQPDAFASYINTAVPSDRFYDDNLWIGIDMAALFCTTRQPEYLQKALCIWQFIQSGTDTILGGGTYWCEQHPEAKHTCSNAPAVVLALRLFEATDDSSFLHNAVERYQWTKQHLRDATDGLYADNIRLNGNIDSTKYAYNSGQMLEAAALLYAHTGQAVYRADAEQLAEACSKEFFNEKGLFNHPTDIWFYSILWRGYLAWQPYATAAHNKAYATLFAKNRQYLWKNRSAEGLFAQPDDNAKTPRYWLLTQTAMIEMMLTIGQKNKK